MAQPAALGLTAVQDSVNCFGGNTGSITATATGGSGGYQYSINSGAFVSSGTFTGLTAGTYTIDARDFNFCTRTLTVNVLAPTDLTLSLVAGSAACAGAGGGQITATAGGGSPGYQYQLNAGAFGPSNVFTSLAPNTYNVTVRDQNGCTETSSIVVSTPTALVVSAVQDSVNCGGGNDGSLVVTASGGTPNYQYSIDGTTFQVSNIFTGLTAGPYTVTVRDANACTQTVNITVLQPVALTIATVQDSASCFGASDGVITVTAGGGSPAYEYSLDGTTFQPSNVFNGQAAGPYTITIRDAQFCQITGNISVLQPTVLGVSATKVDVSCNSTTDGSITVTATGVRCRIATI